MKGLIKATPFKFKSVSQSHPVSFSYKDVDITES